MTPYDVWLSYYSVGGNASALTVAEWFDGKSAPSAHEYDTLAVSVNETLRALLQSEAEAEGGEALWQRLRTVDAAAAARLHPRDTRRVIRALEVALGGASSAASRTIAT